MIEVVETIPSLMFCITVTIDVKEGWHCQEFDPKSMRRKEETELFKGYNYVWY
jgi:hypothetical protein